MLVLQCPRTHLITVSLLKFGEDAAITVLRGSFPQACVHPAAQGMLLASKHYRYRWRGTHEPAASQHPESTINLNQLRLLTNNKMTIQRARKRRLLQNRTCTTWSVRLHIEGGRDLQPIIALPRPKPSGAWSAQRLR